MNRLVLAVTLAGAAALAVDQLQALRARVDELERAPRTEPEFARELARRLASLRQAVDDTRASFENDQRADLLAEGLATVAATLELERCRVSDQAARLSGWEVRWGGREPEKLDVRIEELSADLERRARDLEELRALAARTAERGQAQLAELEQRVDPLLEVRDTQLLWHELVGPVVQLSGDTTVGSGVLLESQPRASSTGWVTHLLTSWHVVRDIYGSIERVNTPVPVRMYERDGTTRDETAHMVAYDVGLDIALLELDLDRPVPHGARLASRDELAAVGTFDGIYAVGCPLGNDPIPTVGEIASTTHVVDGISYWMISAPTYIGNSGGGIFHNGSRRLIGIFSKIYTHGASRSTIVPHMGLATPLPVVYEWLDRGGYAALLGLDASAQPASAKR